LSELSMLYSIDEQLGSDFLTYAVCYMLLISTIVNVAPTTLSYLPWTMCPLILHPLSVRNVVPTLTSSKRRGLSLNGRC
jgi:hypothetical protein